MIARRILFAHVLVPLYVLAIAGIPVLGVVEFYALVEPALTPSFALLMAIPAYVLVTVVVAGVISRFTAHAIVPGKYPRDMAHAVYGPRRLYALCWTCIVSCQPLYHAIVSIPSLKWLAFRLFGYRGSLAFDIYTDTWICDLPLLTLGAGVYLANKVTIAPNMPLHDGSIVVLAIRIGERTTIGQSVMVAPGVTIGADCDIGVGANIGLKVTIGDRSTLGHGAHIDHQTVIGSHCHIGAGAYVGRAAVLHNGVRIPPGMVVPARSTILTQADVTFIAINSSALVATSGTINVGAMTDSSNLSA